MYNSTLEKFDIWRDVVAEELYYLNTLVGGMTSDEIKNLINTVPERSVISVATIIIRSAGIANVVRKINLPRSSLYSVMSGNSNPTYETLTKILDFAGYELAVLPKRNRVESNYKIDQEQK